MDRVGANAGAGWRHEAQMLARCAEHANIVSLHKVIEDAHYVYIIMEECEGASHTPRLALLGCVDSDSWAASWSLPRKCCNGVMGMTPKYRL